MSFKKIKKPRDGRNIFNALPRPQHETNLEEGVEIREQICEASEESRGVQLPQSAEASEEEGVHLGGGGQGGKDGRYLSKLRVKTREFFPP